MLKSSQAQTIQLLLKWD